MSGAFCRSCGAKIWWALTPSKRICPFDHKSAPDGEYVVAAIDGDTVTMRRFEGEQDVAPRYHSHFRTCPNAAAHSRKAKARA